MPVFKKIATLEQKFDHYNIGHTPGIAAMVVQKGKVEFKKGYGLRNLKTKQKVDADTLFRMASVSKQFTGTAIAVLEEQGKIHYEDPMIKYFPDFPDYAQKITIKHLLHHMSGLADYYSELCSTEATAKVLSNQDILDFLYGKSSLDFVPGSQFQYSNSGYNVLASLIEKVSLSSYPEYITSHLFAPAQMDHSLVIGYPEPEIRNRALGYSAWPYFDLNDYNSGNYLHGEDGVYTSLNDMYHWLNALEKNLLVTPKIQQKIFSGTTTNQGKPVHYGYGWMLEDYHGCPMICHSGHWVGFNNFVCYFPNEQLWIVVFSNIADNSSWGAAEIMIKHYLEIK